MEGKFTSRRWHPCSTWQQYFCGKPVFNDAMTVCDAMGNFLENTGLSMFSYLVGFLSPQ